MKTMQSFLGLLLIVLLTPLHTGAADLLITHARLIDGTGASPQEDVSILVREGWITAIGDNASAEGVPTLDAGGATVLPGLIDARVHLFWGPGAFLYDPYKLTNENYETDLEYWRDTYGKYVLQYMRAYLACGVTSIRLFPETKNFQTALLPGWPQQIRTS